MNDPQAPAMFKCSCLNNLSIFIISQDYYELPKRPIRANGNLTLSEMFKISIKTKQA